MFDTLPPKPKITSTKRIKKIKIFALHFHLLCNFLKQLFCIFFDYY